MNEKTSSIFILFYGVVKTSLCVLRKTFVKMARHLHFTDLSDTTCEVKLDLNQQEKRFEFLEVIVKIINSFP